MSRDVVYVDIETTGLEEYHEPVEIAWAVGDGATRCIVLPHLLVRPDPYALSVNGYWRRQLFDKAEWVTPGAEAWGFLRDGLSGNTLAGSNPRFDAFHLRRIFGEELHHHRVLDVPLLVAGALGWEESRGLAATLDYFRENGYPDAPTDNHSAAEGVEAVRWLHERYRGIHAPADR